MREITIYEAEDGTQFELEEECRAYELKMEYGEPDFILLDKNKEKLNIWDERTYEDFFYAYIPTQKDFEAFDELSKTLLGICVDGIDGAGIFAWSDDDSCFLDLKHQLESAQEELDSAKEALRRVLENEN